MTELEVKANTVVLRRLQKTPAQVVEQIAGDIVARVPQLVGTRACNVSTIAVREISYRGIPIAGEYIENATTLVVHPLEILPLTAYLEKKAAGDPNAITERDRAQAKEAVGTILHETLHSCGPDGGNLTEALTEWLTLHHLDPMLRTLNLGELTSAPPVLRGGYPGSAAYLEELLVYAEQLHGVPRETIAAALQRQPSNALAGNLLCNLLGATTRDKCRLVAVALEEIDNASWDIVQRRNGLPREQWDGMMEPLITQGQTAGRRVVEALQASL